MSTLLVSHTRTIVVADETTAEEAAEAISLLYCTACLTGDALVVALPPEMLTIAHWKVDLLAEVAYEGKS